VTDPKTGTDSARIQLEQLERRIERIETMLETNWDDEKPPGTRDRIEKLATEVQRLGKLASTHLDPTEKKPYLGYLIDLGRLAPHGIVLDVGCGPGRIPKELVKYLSFEGAYHGFDIQRKFIDRLEEEFAQQANFHFYHADIKNTEYNPRGKISPTEYRFPLGDNTADLIVLRSVFTHMLPEEIENYMDEIARVLAPGGRSLITYYLLNDQSRPFVESRPRPIFDAYPYDGRGSFPHDHGNYRVRYEQVPERAVALEETFVRELYARHGLEILEPVRYGSWSGRLRYLTGQDLVVAEKPSH
jgi:SAM-dependent methyltransferase